MRNILIIGSTGQIGTELTAAVREHLGNSGTVYAGYTKRRSVPEYLQKTGPSVEIDILDRDALEKIVETYQIDSGRSFSNRRKGSGKRLARWH